MKIVVAPYGWGEARPIDILLLLMDTASSLTQSLKNPLTGTVVVVPSLPSSENPMTYYRVSTDQPFFIELTAHDRKWSQFAYQFSHEFCHVLSDYERLRDSPNNWFHETICELASVFTLRRMAERWLTQPPYPNWSGYSESLASYVQERLSSKEHQLPTGTTLSTWLSFEEEGLRKDCRMREKNSVVAYSLLAIFESDPGGWNAIRNLPDSPSMFKDYIAEWHARVEPADKPFVKRISDAFG